MEVADASSGIRVRLLRWWALDPDPCPTRFDAYHIGDRLVAYFWTPDERPVLACLFGPGPVLF